MSSRPRDPLTGRSYCAQWFPPEQIPSRIIGWRATTDNLHYRRYEPVYQEGRYCYRLAQQGREYCWQHPRRERQPAS